MAPWFKYAVLQGNNAEDKGFGDDEAQELAMPKKSRFRPFRNILIFLGGLAFGGLLTTVVVSSSFSPKDPHVPSRNGYYTTKIVNGEIIKGTQCGETWQEAKSLGCILTTWHHVGTPQSALTRRP